MEGGADTHHSLNLLNLDISMPEETTADWVFALIGCLSWSLSDLFSAFRRGLELLRAAKSLTTVGAL